MKTLFVPNGPKPGTVQVRKGHSLDLIEDVGRFDFLATDPPYAIGGDGAEHAVGAVVATVLRESARKLRPGGYAVIYSASSWRSTFYMVEAVRGILEPIRTATWCKPASRTRVRTPGWSWTSVNIIMFRKRGGRGNPPGAVASSDLDYIIEPPLMVGRRAQLPERVARWSIQPFAEKGLTMLDPFSGSGALCDAAAHFGMASLGFDLDPAKR